MKVTKLGENEERTLFTPVTPSACGDGRVRAGDAGRCFSFSPFVVDPMLRRR